jgi:hypothetical protein
MRRKPWSTATKNRLAASTMAMTSPVVISVSRREGQVTLLASARTSCRNVKGLTMFVAVPAADPFEPLNFRDTDGNGVSPKQSRRGTGRSRATGGL